MEIWFCKLRTIMKVCLERKLANSLIKKSSYNKKLKVLYITARTESQTHKHKWKYRKDRLASLLIRPKYEKSV